MRVVLPVLVLCLCFGSVTSFWWNWNAYNRHNSWSFLWGRPWWYQQSQTQTDCNQELKDAEAERCADLRKVCRTLGDGPYTRCQFASVLQGQMSPFEAGLLFNELDTNNDNSLTTAEINTAVNNIGVCKAYYDALEQQNLINGYSLGVVSR